MARAKRNSDLKTKKEDVVSSASSTIKVDDEILNLFKENQNLEVIYKDVESNEFFTNKKQANRNFKDFKIILREEINK